MELRCLLRHTWWQHIRIEKNPYRTCQKHSVKKKLCPVGRKRKSWAHFGVTFLSPQKTRCVNFLTLQLWTNFHKCVIMLCCCCQQKSPSPLLQPTPPSLLLLHTSRKATTETKQNKSNKQTNKQNNKEAIKLQTRKKCLKYSEQPAWVYLPRYSIAETGFWVVGNGVTRGFWCVWLRIVGHLWEGGVWIQSLAWQENAEAKGKTSMKGALGGGTWPPPRACDLS